MSLRRGMAVHKQIHMFLNGDRTNKNAALINALQRKLRKLGWTLFKTESSFCRDGLRGRLDAIFRKGNCLFIVDWKVTKQIKKIPDLREAFDVFSTPQAQYILQLNLYNFLLTPEQVLDKNIDLEKTRLFLGKVHGNRITFIECQKFTKNFIRRLILRYRLYKCR